MPAIDRFEDALNGRRDTGKGKGIAEILEPRVEELFQLILMKMPPLQHEGDDYGSKAEGARILANEVGVRWRGHHPSGPGGHDRTLES